MGLSSRFIVIALCVPMLSSCGTFKLATSIQAPVDKSASQKETDALVCTHRADLAMNSASQQAKDFLLGATIIGVPLAQQMDKVTARNAFADCMTARGYNLVMPDGSSRRSTISPKSRLPVRFKPPQVQSEAVLTEKSYSSSVGITLPEGWSKASLPSGLNNENILLFATNITSDSDLLLSSSPIKNITNVEEFANSRAASVTSKLSNSKKHNMKHLKINGRESFRFVITGMAQNINIAYVLTVIKGSADVAILCSWTTVDNLPSQRDALERLAYAVNFSEKNDRTVKNEGGSPSSIKPVPGLEDRNVSYKSGFQPVYPQLAIDNRHEGTTVLLIFVDASGAIKEIKVESTSGYHELDQAAVEAAYQWEFNPAVRNGKNVEGVVRIPINFNLNQLTQ